MSKKEEIRDITAKLDMEVSGLIACGSWGGKDKHPNLKRMCDRYYELTGKYYAFVRNRN